MEFQGKEYEYIIWDWLYTLYNPDTAKLYNWVDAFFKEYSEGVTHFLVSFAKHPELRQQIIQNSSIAKYLSEIVIDTANKEEAFLKLKDNHQLGNNVLVIGDNPEHEGIAAQRAGFTFINVFNFAKSLGKTHI